MSESEIEEIRRMAIVSLIRRVLLIATFEGAR